MKHSASERRKFRGFVKKFLRENLQPLAADELLTTEQWLEESNYPKWRKEELLKAREESRDMNTEWSYATDSTASNRKVKMFVKDEFYEEYKYPRNIYGAEDAFKVQLGPIIKSIEKKVFALKYFIKKIPKRERAKYLDEMFDGIGMKTLETDYTSFETHFDSTLKCDCEFEMIRYMTQNLTEQSKVLRWIRATGTLNNVVNKYMYLILGCKRMSGEMDTSLSNGFSNLMFILYAVEKYNLEHRGPAIEGDDGLIQLSGDIPSEYFKLMGLNVKMIWHDEFSHASFCGMVFDREEKIIITNPLPVLATTPWINRKYVDSTDVKLKALLRAKALSLVWEYPGCPIIYEYGKKLLELTSEVKADWGANAGWWESQTARYVTAEMERTGAEFPVVAVGPRTRALMEAKYHVTVEQQHSIERDITKMTWESFTSITATDLMPDVWKINYKNYVYEGSIDPLTQKYPTLGPFAKQGDFHSITEASRTEARKFGMQILSKDKFVKVNNRNNWFAKLSDEEKNTKYEDYTTRKRRGKLSIQRKLQEVRLGPNQASENEFEKQQ